jgi:hypothetical protein
VQSDAKCGELYGTIFGTFLDFSAPLAAPFDYKLSRNYEGPELARHMEK